MTYRIDIGTLNPPTRRDDGTIVVDARPTRAGVFLYRNFDGSIRREWRPESEVFAADSLASLNLRSVTNDHPGDMVDANSAGRVTVGMTANDARRDETFVRTTIAVYDASAIGDMEAGKRQLSCGYGCTMDPRPGIVPAGHADAGQHYDQRQTMIRYNHVAIVDLGRAGPQCAAKMDAAIMTSADVASAIGRKDASIMDPQALQALMTENANNKVRADNAERTIKTLEAECDAAKKRADDADAARAKAESERDTATKARTDSDAGFEARVAARVKLNGVAAAAKVDKYESMSDKALKIAVVAKLDGATIADTESDVYVNGRFDAAVERATKAGNVLDTARVAADASKGALDNTDAHTKADEAERKMREHNANAWRPPAVK